MELPKQLKERPTPPSGAALVFRINVLRAECEAFDISVGGRVGYQPEKGLKGGERATLWPLEVSHHPAWTSRIHVLPFGRPNQHRCGATLRSISRAQYQTQGNIGPSRVNKRHCGHHVLQPTQPTLDQSPQILTGKHTQTLTCCSAPSAPSLLVGRDVKRHLDPVPANNIQQPNTTDSTPAIPNRHAISSA